MEKITANTDGRHMSDVAMAGNYVREIGGLKHAFRLLARLFPHHDEPKKQWTERRVRGFMSGDAATVQFREMIELHQAAEEAKAERSRLASARKEHAEFIAKTARLRSLLEHQDEDFHRPQIEGLRGIAGGVDRARTDD